MAFFLPGTCKPWPRRHLHHIQLGSRRKTSQSTMTTVFFLRKLWKAQMLLWDLLPKKSSFSAASRASDLSLGNGRKLISCLNPKLSSSWSQHVPVYSSSVLCWVVQSCLTLCDSMDCSLPGLLSMEFSRQEYWSGLPCPPPGDLPNPEIEPASPALQVDSLPAELLVKPS